MTSAIPGKVYRHQKGGLYQVLMIATHTETGEELVIYEDVESKRVWARPKAMFEGDRDGEPRFEPGQPPD